MPGHQLGPQHRCVQQPSNIGLDTELFVMLCLLYMSCTAIIFFASAQVEVVPHALLGHQVNYANYYHVFIETLPTWHNIICKYLKLCDYDKQSKLQLWLMEERGPGAYTDLNFRLPALGPLYACLSPSPPRHLKDPFNFGKVSATLDMLGTLTVVYLLCCLAAVHPKQSTAWTHAAHCNLFLVSLSDMRVPLHLSAPGLEIV